MQILLLLDFFLIQCSWVNEYRESINDIMLWVLDDHFYMTTIIIVFTLS